jgi:hypothetical protein
MHSVRFGTGSGRETQHAHLADFFKLVDRGVQVLFRSADIPLILAGVEEDTAIYRRVTTYRGLLKNGIAGLDVAREQITILQQAYTILRNDSIERDETALRAAMERTAPARFKTDPAAILEAAFEGRVSQLYVDERAEKVGVFSRGIYRSWGREDLLNLAIVQTILHHGEACELPSEAMPPGLAAVGIMRF